MLKKISLRNHYDAVAMQAAIFLASFVNTSSRPLYNPYNKKGSPQGAFLFYRTGRLRQLAVPSLELLAAAARARVVAADLHAHVGGRRIVAHRGGAGGDGLRRHQLFRRGGRVEVGVLVVDVLEV